MSTNRQSHFRREDCASDGYLFKDRILDTLAGKWIWRTNGWSTKEYNTGIDEDSAEESDSDAE